MYRVISRITFQQVNPSSNNGVTIPRAATLIYNFAHQFSAQNTWKALTDSGEITLPKKINVRDKAGTLIPFGGTNVNIGGFSSTAPIFLRGDKVKIEWGYMYYDARGNEINPMTTIFQGYISQVTSKKPMVLKVEDNMFVLKQTPARGLPDGNGNARKFFPGSQYTVEKIFRELIKAAGLSYTVNALTQTSIGDIKIENETIAEVLARFQKDYHFESYFRGNELRVGSWPYLESDAVASGKKIFNFQQNIISDDLDYRRKDDITLSAVCSNTITETTGKFTRDGQAKTQKKKLEVLITFQNGSDKPTFYEQNKTDKVPPSTGGERHQFFFWGVTDINELKKRGVDQLRKYFYTGFKGSFTTFGIPYVQLGDNVDILDNELPERNGRYKVREVHYDGGVNGLRQKIELEYLIFPLDSNGKPLLKM